MKLLIILYLFSSVGCFHVDAGPELATTDAAVPVDHDLQDVGWDEAKTSLVLANNVINDADSSTLKRSRRRRKKKMNSWPLKSAAAASDNLEKKQQLEHLFSQASSSSMNADGRQALHRHAKLRYYFFKAYFERVMNVPKIRDACHCFWSRAGLSGVFSGSTGWNPWELFRVLISFLRSWRSLLF